MDAVHEQLHGLRAAEQRAGPADDEKFPSVRATAGQKLSDDILAAGGKKVGEVADGVEERGAVADPTGGETDGDEQGWKKGEEHVEGDGLRDHAASRKDTPQYPPDFCDQGRPREVSGIIP